MTQAFHDPGIQRTAAGLRYEKFITAARDALAGMSAEDQAKAKKANVDFIRGLNSPRYGESAAAEVQQRAIGPANVHVDTLLADMSVMYKNDVYIGDQLMPAVQVSHRSNKFTKYPKRERLAFPDDLIGHRGSPNELDASRTTDNYSVIDYGYKNFLDLEVVQNQDAPLNEMVDVVEAINEGIAFRREKRILAIVGASGNYSGNTAARGTAWTTGNSGGSIISDLLAAGDAMWNGATPTRKLGFCTLTVWNSGIVQNAALATRFQYTNTGLMTTKQVASWFGLDDILVIRSREDTANIGQAASYARMLTTEVFGIISVAKNPGLRSAHFGSTFRMAGDPFTTEWNDPGIGKRGGIWARVSVSEDHKVVAGDAGFLITGILT